MKRAYAHDIKTAAMSVAWDAERVRLNDSQARITYTELRRMILDVDWFINRFSHLLSFDDTGLTMQRRE